MNKRVTVEEIIEAAKMIRREGIAPRISCMFGQPGETLDHFINTIKVFLMSTDPLQPVYNQHDIGPLMTFPGAPIYDYAKKHGYVKNDEHYYRMFFEENRQGWINYTAYSDETVWKMVSAGRLLNEINFCKSTRSHHEHQLLSMLNPFEKKENSFRPMRPEDIPEFVDAVTQSGILKGKRLVLYGISDVAESLLKAITRMNESEVAGLADGYKEKHGRKCIGHTILPLGEISEDDYDAVVICTKSIESEQQVLQAISKQTHNGKETIGGYTYWRLFCAMTSIRNGVPEPRSEHHEVTEALESLIRDLL